ncbi:MAG: hypothetical protein KatS3mg026_0793 [Bacteroidia bacterium]|nr:MAG: hypothetical protein KatS3mg026_0793 [Bacteroidia bacterium]
MPEKPKSKVRPALPSGFRDFGPAEVRRRRAVFETLIRLFERFGYEPLETPAVELLSVLTGKYGEEGDRLLFRILNSGDFLEGVPPEAYKDSRSLLPHITEKALRYDLTVPMARWVAQHAGQLVFPFKRYQIQPVWRADRPQRGRFREFYQCDVDIVGAEGIQPLFEMVTLAREGLACLGVTGAVLHLNHRALLEAAAAQAGWPPDQFGAFCTLLDKADKIGWQAVQTQFAEKGYTLPDWLSPEAPASHLWEQLASLPATEADVPALQQLLTEVSPSLTVRWDATLARGLEYYTGYVYEVRGTRQWGRQHCGRRSLRQLGGRIWRARPSCYGALLWYRTHFGFAPRARISPFRSPAGPGSMDRCQSRLHPAGGSSPTCGGLPCFCLSRPPASSRSSLNTLSGGACGG